MTTLSMRKEFTHEDASLVTIGIPVYKRLQFLPQAVQYGVAQDYENVELIVSDNGVNGSAIPELVGQ